MYFVFINKWIENERNAHVISIPNLHSVVSLSVEQVDRLGLSLILLKFCNAQERI